MRIQWRKEWTTPAVVGVASFAAGAAVGAVAYKIKIDREIEAGLQAMAKAAPKKIGTVDAIITTDQGLEIQGTISDEKTLDILQGKGPYVVEMELDDPSILVPSSTDLTLIDTGVGSDEPTRTPEDSEVEVCDTSPVEPEPVPEVLTPETRNVFSIPWDSSNEAGRSEDAPYVLHQDEYFADEKGYRQTQLTYYAGDDILTDDHQVPIYDTSILGNYVFGQGASDPDSVYIRNDKLKAEYEVVREHTHYQVAVMGLHAEEMAENDELRHSQRILRFRDE